MEVYIGLVAIFTPIFLLIYFAYKYIHKRGLSNKQNEAAKMESYVNAISTEPISIGKEKKGNLWIKIVLCILAIYIFFISLEPFVSVLTGKATWNTSTSPFPGYGVYVVIINILPLLWIFIAPYIISLYLHRFIIAPPDYFDTVKLFLMATVTYLLFGFFGGVFYLGIFGSVFVSYIAPPLIFLLILFFILTTKIERKHAFFAMLWTIPFIILYYSVTYLPIIMFHK